MTLLVQFLYTVLVVLLGTLSRRFILYFGRFILRIRSKTFRNSGIGCFSILCLGRRSWFNYYSHILKKAKVLRVSKRIEEEGLDVYEHGENAYN